MKKIARKMKKKSRFSFMKLSSQGKLLVLAGAGAVCIGLFLGMISLQLTKQEVTEPFEKPISAINEQPTESGSTQKLEPLHFFVVQGGVFSEEENANVQAKQFSGLNYNTYNWTTNDGVYLLAGVFGEEGDAKSLASEMEQDGLDVFVKKWDVHEQEVSMTKDEWSWLDQFVTLWQQSVNDFAENGDASMEEWDKLMEDKVASDSTLEVIHNIQEIWKEHTDINVTSLLKMMDTYEKGLEHE